MLIRYGSTRVVLLVGNTAIKIGRIRPLRVLSRAFILPFSRKRREHFFGKYGDNIVQAIARDLFAGIVANRNEYAYWGKHRDPRVMPTTSKWLCGLIVAQPRGIPVPAEDNELIKLMGSLRMPSINCDINFPTQYCRLPEGRLVLVDYGRDQTLLELSRA